MKSLKVKFFGSTTKEGRRDSKSSTHVSDIFPNSKKESSEDVQTDSVNKPVNQECRRPTEEDHDAGWEEMAAKDFVGTLRKALNKKREDNVSEARRSASFRSGTSFSENVSMKRKEAATEKDMSPRDSRFLLGRQRELSKSKEPAPGSPVHHRERRSQTAAVSPKVPRQLSKGRTSPVFQFHTSRSPDRRTSKPRSDSPPLIVEGQDVSELEDEEYDDPLTIFYEFIPPLRRTRSEPTINSWDFTPFRVLKNVNEVDTQIAEQEEKNRVSLDISRKQNEQIQEAVRRADTKLTPSHRKSFHVSREGQLDKLQVVKQANGTVSVVSGTLEQLVNALADESILDKKYIDTFLMSYRFITTGETLLDMLINRYRYNPKNVPAELVNEFRPTVQIRVLLILQIWLDDYFNDDFRNNKSLTENFIKFCKDEVSNSPNAEFGSILNSIMQRKFSDHFLQNINSVSLLLETEYKKRSKELNGFQITELISSTFGVDSDIAIELCLLLVERNVLVTSMKLKSTDLKNTFSTINNLGWNVIVPKETHATKSVISVLSYQPTEIAQQLTLVEFEFYKAIQISEFSNCAWTKKETKFKTSPNLLKMIEFSNSVILWVATEIITTPNLRKRVTILKHFVSIAQACVKINNFNAVFEILAGLNIGSVRRLAQTWKGLPEKYLETLLHLEELVNSDDNWKTYRHTLETIKKKQVPVIPYLGVFLKDVIYIDDSSKTFVQDNLYNFKKLSIYSSIFSDMKAFQSYLFGFRTNAILKYFLLNEKEFINENDLYKHSKWIEPPKEGATSRRKRLAIHH